jgi:hypothetical protein
MIQLIAAPLSPEPSLHCTIPLVCSENAYHVPGKVSAMRSDLVFDALQTKNRFALCHQAFRAIRLLHKPSTRVEDTTNNALQRLAGVQRHPCLANAEDGDETRLTVTQEQVAIEVPLVAPLLPGSICRSE